MAVGFVTLDDSNNLPSVVTAQFAGVVKAPTNGVTPALSAFQAAVTAANGKPLFVPPGDYLFDGSLTGKVNLTFAPGARILQTVNLPAIELTGTGSETSRGLQSAAAAGQNIINCNAVGLVAGDWVLIRSAAVFPGSTAGSKIGELHRVRQVDGTTQFRTISNLDHSYAITTSSVVKFGMLEGVRLLGSGEFINTIGATMKLPMLRFTACADLAVDVSIRDAGGPGITLSADTLFDVRARIRGSLNDEANGNFGYGVEAFGVSCHGRAHVDMVGGRHAFTTTSGATTAGVPRHIDVYGIAEGTTNTAWDTHEEGEYINFRGVTAFGCRNGSIKHRAPNSSVIEPVVRNCLGLGVRFAPTAFGGSLHGGELRDIRYLSEGSPGVGVSIEADDVVISGDPRIDCDDQAVLVATAANRSRIKSGSFTAGKRANADTNVAIDYQGTSTNHRIDRGVSIESAAVGIKAAATVTDVRVSPLRNDATSRVVGDVHLLSDALSPRRIETPAASTVRSALVPTTTRVYLAPLEIRDDQPWTSFVPKILVGIAGGAADSVEVAVYDLARNRLATTGPQVGLDVVGVKTLPTLTLTPLLRKRYLLAVQFVTAGTLSVHAGSFALASAASLPGTTDDLLLAGYVTTASPLPTTLGGVASFAVTTYPWVQLTPA
ncbi:hypothetical protein CH274_13115 [Rhodococcus sp. 06-418-5]|uniref:hypothetical protein n=1 Tax=Rhodococcus sp. 06-418-5 TaxID=2022507 RepID=UPI000B9AF19D|nr:hypothetical protein [Rhodococcus sp. 06-418-5]OZC80171.1 hypothetical protein CH274_13115 [Rhodococcus sp. 06-418-5]